MTHQITTQNHSDVNFMTDCINGYDFVENLSNQLNTKNGISFEQIQSIENRIVLLKKGFENLNCNRPQQNESQNGNEFATHLFQSTVNKTEELFKKYTVLIEVHYQSQCSLYISGDFQGDWLSKHSIKLEDNSLRVIRVPKPLQENLHFEFKIRHGLSLEEPEWQPGNNLKIHCNFEKITITIGSFSDLNTFNIRVQEDEIIRNERIKNNNSLALEIIKSSESFYSSEYILKNGKKIYFTLEKLDANNICFWKTYTTTARKINDYFEKFCSDFPNSHWATKSNGISKYLDLSENDFFEKFCSDFPYSHWATKSNGISKYLDLNESEYKKLIVFMVKKKYFVPPIKALGITFNPFSGSGIVGMRDPLNEYKHKQVFIAYASKEPIQEGAHHHFEEDKSTDTTWKDIRSPYDSSKTYNTHFGNILMSVGVITTPQAPVVTHIGIFRNPLDFFDLEEKYKGISMLLHGFASKTALSHFNAKKYMVTNPVDVMAKIMVKTLGENALFIGKNEIWHSDYVNRRLNRNCPPIYHIDTKTKIHKIAKEGVNLSDYPDTLPEEKTQFCAPHGETLNFSSFDRGSDLTTVIKLEKLAECYR